MELNRYRIEDFPPYHIYVYLPSFMKEDKVNDIIWDLLKEEGFVISNVG